MQARTRLIEASRLDSLPPTEWAINGILPVSILATLSGAYGCFKSFQALEMAFCVATGLPWQGCDTRRGAVVYVAAEGLRGLQRRVRALEIARGMAADNLYIWPSAVQLLEPAETGVFMAALDDLDSPPRLILFDTQARCTIGMDENSAREGSLLVAALDDLRQRYGATVMLIHHHGKSGAHRGTTAIPAAMDTIIEVARQGERGARVECAKMKDDEPFAPIALRARVVEIGEGETSLVFNRAEGGQAGKLTERQQTALRALDNLAGRATSGDWQRASGLSASTFYLVVEQLMSAGRVTKGGNGRGGVYALTPNSNVTPTELQLE